MSRPKNRAFISPTYSRQALLERGTSILSRSFGRSFTIIFLLTEGGPASCTETIVIRSYLEAFKFFHVGTASAIGVIVLLISLVFSLVYLGMAYRKETSRAGSAYRSKSSRSGSSAQSETVASSAHHQGTCFLLGDFGIHRRGRLPILLDGEDFPRERGGAVLLSAVSLAEGRHVQRLPRGARRATGQDAGSVYMPAPQSGSPMTYMLGGAQYIVLAIGGGNYPAELMAFRLPRNG